MQLYHVERRLLLTMDGIRSTIQFFSMIETSVLACSDTRFCAEGSPSAAARKVSITLALISASGSSSPRRKRGISYYRYSTNANPNWDDCLLLAFHVHKLPSERL
jgi:hypothetical protein